MTSASAPSAAGETLDHSAAVTRPRRTAHSRKLCALLLIGALQGASPSPATDYDPGVPTPESVLGYRLGAWVTDYGRMESYLSALAEASPRVLFGSYGTDYEHRQLRYVAISSTENLQRLEAIQLAMRRLADPRRWEAGDRDALVDGTPLVIWLNYSTDGNETAGLESALLMAYHLGADRDAATRRLLDQAVIVITPVMNPSSHERWTTWSNSFATPGGNPDPRAMEHHPPWGVLTNNNHYLVDLNRESLWATQRESAALRTFYYEWYPVIFVDHHGEYDNFTGPGYDEPLNPLFTPAQRRWLSRLGEAIGERFGARGWSYSPWETGTFYPGFWESIGLLNGAIGFTYETIGGGSKGLAYRRDDGSIITLELAARQHFEASMAVLETAVAARRELLADFASFFETALTLEKSAPEKAFLVAPTSDPQRAERLLEVLRENRIEVYRTTREHQVRGVEDYFGQRWEVRSFPAGAFVIPVAQPQARLLLTLMRRDLRLPEATLAAAEIFRQNQEKAGFFNPQIAKTRYLFYDVTAWSLPLTFDVEAFWTEHPPSDGLESADGPPAVVSQLPKAAGRYGYLIPGDTLHSAALLADLLRQGVVVNVAYSRFAIAGREYPRGSLLVRNERNSRVDLWELLTDTTQLHGVDLFAVDSPHSESGPSLGSDQFVWVRPPKIAVLTGDPVSVRSYGDLWFNLERLYGVPFSGLYREQLDAAALDEYDVLVLPHGRYRRDTFTDGWIEALRDWLGRGGTLICLKGAARWAADPELGLASVRLRPTEWPLDGQPGNRPRATMELPGAILRAHTDPHHFLTFGYRGATPVLVDSNLAFASNPELAAPLRFAALEELRLAGFAYPDSLARLAETPYLAVEQVGSGSIIMFLDDPNFRVYWFGLHRLFLNSLLLGPSF